MNDPLFFEKFTLTSGLDVYFQPRNLNWFGCKLVIRTGQRHDPPGKEELAHLLEHCLASGTQGLPRMSLPEYQRWIDDRDLEFDFGATSLDFTAYGGKAPAESLEMFFAFLSTYVLKPSLDAGIGHERAIIRAERREKSSPRLRQIDRRRLRAVFGDHRLASVQGWASDKVLAGLTLDDVRHHHRRHYNPANMALVVVGGIDADHLRQTLERMFGGYRDPLWAPDELPSIDFRPPKPSEFYSKLPGGKPDSVIIQYYWYLPPARKALLIMARNGLEELVDDRVREKLRLAYGVSSDTSYLLDHSILTLKTEVSPKMVARTRATFDAALVEVDKLVGEMPRLIDGFRRGLNFLEFTAEKTIEVAAKNVSLLGDPHTTRETLAKVESLTAEEFRDLLLEFVHPGRAYVEMVEV